MWNMEHPAYHGPISKQRCEELLGKKGRDGTYLIRESETIQGALCLCVYKQKVVYTYRILQTHTGYFTLQASTGVEEKFFKTLKDLIHHYKQKNQGLATRLCRSLKRKTVQDQPLPCAAAIVHKEENDYENVDCGGDYVVVLPDWYSGNVMFWLDTWIRQYEQYRCAISFQELSGHFHLKYRKCMWNHSTQIIF